MENASLFRLGLEFAPFLFIQLYDLVFYFVCNAAAFGFTICRVASPRAVSMEEASPSLTFATEVIRLRRIRGGDFMGTTSTPPSQASVVKIGAKKCRPFILDVMVYSPESGYKAVISVERGCTAANDSIWKFVFDLFKKQKTGTDFDQLVHVSYKGLNAAENAAIAGMVNGLSDNQADKLPDLHEASKNFVANPSQGNQVTVTKAAQSVVNG